MSALVPQSTVTLNGHIQRFVATCRCPIDVVWVASRKARHLLLASQGPALPWLQAGRVRFALAHLGQGKGLLRPRLHHEPPGREQPCLAKRYLASWHPLDSSICSQKDIIAWAFLLVVSSILPPLLVGVDARDHLQEPIKVVGSGWHLDVHGSSTIFLFL